jgi:hypothetical protein
MSLASVLLLTAHVVPPLREYTQYPLADCTVPTVPWHRPPRSPGRIVPGGQVCVGMPGGAGTVCKERSFPLTVMSLRVIPQRQRPSFGKKLYLLRHLYCGIFAK